MKREVWKKKELRNIGAFKNGLNKPIENFGHGTKFVNISDVYLPELDVNGLGRVETLPEDLLIYKLEANDILFVRSSVKPDGIGYTTIFKGSNEIIVYCGFIIRYRLFDKNLNPDLLNFILRSITYRKKIIAASTVSANTNVNQSTLSKITILYPNESTVQSRIALILSSCDDTIRTTQAVIDKYKAVKQGMMRDLFTRGLAADGTLRPSYEQQPELYKPSELGMIPKDWDVKTLIECSNKINDGIHTTPKFCDGSDFYFINGNNFVNGKIIIGDKTECVPKEEYKKYFIELTSDTLLLSINGTIGKLAYYANEKIILGKSAAYICCKNSIDVVYLFHFFELPIFFKIVRHEITGSTISNLSLSSIRRMAVPLPSFPEQRAIADRLSAIDASISSEEALLAKYQAVKQGLMDRLLTPPEDAVIEDETEGDIK